MDKLSFSASSVHV